MARFPSERSPGTDFPLGIARPGRVLAVAWFAVCAALGASSLPAQDAVEPVVALAARIERAAAAGIVGLSGLRAEKPDLTQLVDAFCIAEIATDARDLTRRTLFRGRHAALEAQWHSDPARRVTRAPAFGALGTAFLVEAWLTGDDASRTAVVAAAGHFAADRYSELLRELRAAGPEEPRWVALESMARELVRTVERQPITPLVEALECEVPIDPFGPIRHASPALLLLTHHPRVLDPDLPRGARARLAVLRREALASDLPLPIPLRLELLRSAPTDAAVAAADRGPLDATIRARLLLRMADADPSAGLSLLTASLWNPRDGLDPTARLAWIEACLAALETAHARLPPPGPQLTDDDPIARFVGAAVARDPEARVLTVQCADRIARAGNRAFATRLLTRLDHADFVPGRDVPRIAGPIQRMLHSEDPALAGTAASVAATLLYFREFPPLHEALVDRALECLERRRGDREWLSSVSRSRNANAFDPVPLAEDLPGDARLVEAAARAGGPGLVTPLLDLYQEFDGPAEPGAQAFILACLGGVAHHATDFEVNRLLETVGAPVVHRTGGKGFDTSGATILTGLYCAAPAERLDEIAARCHPSFLAPTSAVFRTLGLRSRHLSDPQRQRVLRWISAETSLPCFDELMLSETIARAADDGPLANAARERLARTCSTAPEPVFAYLRSGTLDPSLLLDHLDALPWPTIADLARHVRDPALRGRFHTALAARLAVSEPDATSIRLLARTLPEFEELAAAHHSTARDGPDTGLLVSQLANDRDDPRWDASTLTRVVELASHPGTGVRAAAYAALATRDPVLYPEARLAAERALGEGH